MMQYLFQGFNCRADQKYKDLLHDIGTEEIGHVEMLATMIARLLDNAPVKEQEEAYQSDPALAAVMGGMNPQHAIVAGLGQWQQIVKGIRGMQNNHCKRKFNG